MKQLISKDTAVNHKQNTTPTPKSSREEMNNRMKDDGRTSPHFNLERKPDFRGKQAKSIYIGQTYPPPKAKEEERNTDPKTRRKSCRKKIARELNSSPYKLYFAPDSPMLEIRPKMTQRRARFRLSKDTVELIIEEIREAISCIRYEVNILTNEEKVSITLRSTLGSTLQDVGDFAGIDR
ncbi:hypothetical protein JTB14_004439 [Gonioctena quinquepunctata]|nr:hypothetical protein JTB14_004439 [Gonioctena quinquepunctata]